MTKFRSFSVADAVAAAAAALSDEARVPVAIEAVQDLGGEQRRNIIARGSAVQEGVEDRPVIVKATRAANYDAQAATVYQTFGFAKEWAATRYLQLHASELGCAPALLAADLERGVLVYDDLGGDLPSLVKPLLAGSAARAEAALVAYAMALAALHRATVGCRAGHTAVVRDGYAAATVPPAAEGWVETVARAPHLLLGGAFPDAEAELIAEHLRRPGGWQALVHGDPCPDNVLLTADGARLIDFEFSRPSHALFDAAYWRMGFPTCWCAGMVPKAVRERIDLAYRRAVVAAVPAAGDDEQFQRESAIVDMAWMLGNLSWLLEGALADDGVWGRSTNRSRIVTYLDVAARSAETADILPGFRALARSWREELDRRWPGTTTLPDFPAFARGSA